MNSPELLKARKALNNLRAYVRRTGLTGWVKDRDAGGSYRRAFEAVVKLEDAHGIDAAAALSDRLTELRREATAAGLLDVCDVSGLEQQALANVERDRVNAERRAARIANA